jgi:hypothetical protein
MKRTVLAEHVVDLQANLLAALFNDGSIELYVDEQPDDGPDLDFLPRSPIGVFKLGSPAFSKANDGKIILYPTPPAIIMAAGRIKWARAFSAARDALMDLDVGSHEHTSNVVLPKTDVRPGDQLVILSFSHCVSTSTEGC